MTFEEVLAAVEGRKILRHQSKVFFCIYTSEEAAQFKDLGAYVTGAGGHDKEWGAPCWEVHFYGMLDPMLEESEDEEPRDVRLEFLLNYFRDRDGYGAGLERILA